MSTAARARSRQEKTFRPATPRNEAGSRIEKGAVTAELALGLPVVVVVLAAVLMLATAATAQMRCADAARAAARSVALGEDPATVAGVVTRVAGDDATSGSTRAGDWVTVTVSAPVTGWLSALPLTASAEAVARVEP